MNKDRTRKLGNGHEVDVGQNKGLRKLCACERRVWAKCSHSWYFNFAWKGRHYRFSLDRYYGRKMDFSLETGMVKWQQILELAIICIADRAQPTLAQTQFDAYAPHNHRFFTLKLPLMPISATQVRQLMASGAAAAEEVARLVPEPVARYISLHQLYGPG